MESVKYLYKVNTSFGFAFNKRVLLYLYLPIIGQSSYTLYNWLVEESNLQTELINIQSNHERILLSLNFSLDEFCEAKKNLEAMGLIETFYTQTKTNPCYIYKIIPPLSYDYFINNGKYKKLLINKIGINEFERINLAFKNRNFNKNLINVSTTFEMKFNSTDIDETECFNFIELSEQINKELQKPVLINSESSSVIETFFKCHNLSFNEIKKSILSSLVELPVGYGIDNNLLNQNLLSLIYIDPNSVIEQNVTLCRDENIFYDKKISEHQKNKIISDYKNINSNKYMYCIQKSSLDEEQIKLLKHLRNVSCLSDPVINVMIDYSVYKTYGKINSKYLMGMAKSINSLNLKTVEEVISYLQSLSIKFLSHEKQNKNIFKKNKNSSIENVNAFSNREELVDDYSWDVEMK